VRKRLGVLSLFYESISRAGEKEAEEIDIANLHLKRKEGDEVEDPPLLMHSIIIYCKNKQRANIFVLVITFLFHAVYLQVYI
jgi:hypothetical protein